VFDERFIKAKTTFLKDTHIYEDSLPSKILNPSAGNPRIRIATSHHHPTNPATNNGLSARRSSALMVARLQGHVEGSRLCLIAGILQGMDLCMRAPCFPMVTLSHHSTALDNYRPHHGIRGSVPNTSGGQTEG